MTIPVAIVQRESCDRLGEGLHWSSSEQALYWTDILGCRVHRLSLSRGGVESWTLPDVVGWVIGRKSGGLVAGLGRQVMALTLEPLSLKPIADLESDKPANRVNDAKADACGRIWAGTMPFSADSPDGALYRIDPDGTVRKMDTGYTIANGPAIGDDWLLHTDTALRTIFRHPLHDDGSLGPRQPFITFEDGWGNPDGMTLDADGCLWVACWDGGCVRRFDETGACVRKFPLPASQITNVTFAGPGLDRMFVTSAAEGVCEHRGGALFEIEPGCKGRPTYQFGG